MSYSKNNGMGFLDDLGKAVESFVNNSGINEIFDGSNTKRTVPPANVVETATHLVVEIAIAGKQKSDFNIEVEDNQLIVALTASESTENKNIVNIIKKEFDFSTFRRTFRLDNKYNAQHITATYEQGVLCIKVGLKSPDQKTKIKVEVD